MVDKNGKSLVGGKTDNAADKILRIGQKHPPQFQNWWDYMPDEFREAVQDFDSLQGLLSDGGTWSEFSHVMARFGMPSDERHRSLNAWKKIAETSKVVQKKKVPNEAGGHYEETTTHYYVLWGVWKIIIEDIVFDAPWQVGGNSGQKRDVASYYLRLNA